MPQVASDATSAVFRPAPPTVMRPALSSDGAPDLPFESLLDTADTQADPPPPAPQASQSTQPAQPPQVDPHQTGDESADGTAAKADGKSDRKADGKADDKTPDKTASKLDGKTAGKTDDKTTAKVATPNQPVVNGAPLGPNDDEAANTTNDVKLVEAPDSIKAPQVLQQPAPQPPAQTGDDTKTPDVVDAIVAALAPATPKTPGETKVKTDVKIGETAKDTNIAKTTDDTQDAGAKTSGDVKPAAGPAPVIAAAVQTIAPVQAPTPIVAAPTAPAPAVPTSTTVDISQIAPLDKQTVTVAAKTPAAPKAKTDDFAPLQDGAEKLDAHPHDDTSAPVQREATDKPAPIATNAQSALPKATTDVIQQSAPPTPPDVTQAVTPPPAPLTPASPAPPAAQSPPVPIAGVAIEIATQAQAGKNHFEIRLDPPELGRIEVRLDVDRDGHVTSSLIADRSDTLNLLRNDASGLQRALQDAGLKTSDNGLQFSLRDQSMGGQQNPAPATANTTQIVVQDSMLPAGDIAQRNYSRLADLRGGVDIRV